MRVMLDTNLWSYIGDQVAGERVKRLMRARGHRTVSPPSVLLEVLQHPLDDKRAAIVRAHVATTDERLRTEADVEAAEVIAEARRLRPGWVRALPDSGREATWRTFWTKQVWRQAVEHHERFRQTKPFEQRKREVEHIVAAQRETRQQVLHAKFSLTDLAGLMAQPVAGTDPGTQEGWGSGHSVEAWRVHNQETYWHAFAVARRAIVTHEDTTVADWVGSRLDLAKTCAQRADFNKFWPVRHRSISDASQLAALGSSEVPPPGWTA